MNSAVTQAEIEARLSRWLKRDASGLPVDERGFDLALDLALAWLKRAILSASGGARQTMLAELDTLEDDFWMSDLAGRPYARAELTFRAEQKQACAPKSFWR